MFYLWHFLSILSLFIISFFGGYSFALKNELRHQQREAHRQ